MKVHNSFPVKVDLTKRIGFRSIAAIEGDPTTLVRWQEVDSFRASRQCLAITPLRFDPQEWSNRRGGNIVSLRDEVSAASEMAESGNLHFQKLRSFGAAVVACDYSVVPNTPDTPWKAGVMTLVPKLPASLSTLTVSEAQPANYARILPAINKYVAWACHSSDVVLNDIVFPYQWSADPSNPDTTVLHDVGLEFTDIRYSGIMTRNAAQTIHDVVCVTNQAGLVPSVPTQLVAEAFDVLYRPRHG